MVSNLYSKNVPIWQMEKKLELCYSFIKSDEIWIENNGIQKWKKGMLQQIISQMEIGMSIVPNHTSLNMQK